MKIFLIITSLFIGVGILGQGNLQFNRAVHTEISCTSTSVTSGVVGVTLPVVVPIGKTLKITSANISNYRTDNTATTATNTFNSKLVVDNSAIAFCEYASYGKENHITNNLFPLWLPPGTYNLKIIYKCSNNSIPYTSEAYISGIEFNIVP